VLSRRSILKVGAVLGGGFLLGFKIPSSEAASTSARTSNTAFAPNAFIRIDPQGKIALIMPQAEMGQGVYTSHAMILAEELDAAFAQVSVEASPPSNALYRNPVLGLQATGGSNSTRAFWMPLRKAGAAAREMLVASAAAAWRVDPATCRTENSEVIHDSSGRRLGYGALAARAAEIAPPADPPLKAVKDFKLIGKPLKRLDTPEKVNGKAHFGIDAMPRGVKFATLAASPVFGGKVGRVDDSRAKAMPGVHQIVVLDDLVGVVADHYWAAKQGLAALEIEWNEGANAAVNSDLVWKRIAAASERVGAVAKSLGDVDKALSAGERLEAIYQLPFLAHAPMEPMNCTVHVCPDSCEVWVGCQVQARGQAAAAKLTGLPLDKIVFHNHLVGGGFGRRLDVDGIEKAVRIAQQVDGPVKVVWSREEDVQQDFYRPVYYDRLAASLQDGKISGWNHRITGSSVLARWRPSDYTKDIDSDAVASAVDLPYDIPDLRVQYVREEPPAVPTGFWRGVGPNNNVFAIECFIDELANKAGKDPVAFRRDMLGRQPRLKAALDLAANKSGWGQPLRARVGRGVVAQTSFASFIAAIAEVEVDENGEVNVRRIVCGVDTGIAVNPDIIIAQLQGGLIFGLTAALYGEITVDKGRVRQSNFNNYRMLRINQTPAIEIHLIQSDAPPGGIGETGTTAAPPAVCNAIHAATGIRLRKLPIDRDILAGRKST
jgi:isoquinoline 1-oxidoreductase beta subunit